MVGIHRSIPTAACQDLEVAQTPAGPPDCEAGACPFVDHALSRCRGRFQLNAIDRAMDTCFGDFQACPVYRALAKDGGQPEREHDTFLILTVRQHDQLRPTGS